MNRFSSIFGFFRHGHAEGISVRHDPFLLFHTFALGLIEKEESEVNHFHSAAILARWVRETESRNGLRLNWAVCSEGGRKS